MPHVKDKYKQKELAKQIHVSTLEKNIYTYANYEKLADEAPFASNAMRESKDFYGERILISIEAAFKGKSRDEISEAVQRLIESMA